ncbi:uncharacterized protein [Macrobrachium rosenbergii]|uniref:uncharacterized protein isoform X2 n=1 Tax=Macrobrachium rosenbergii TaxID=79674 RepID=UPI0034D52242
MKTFAAALVLITLWNATATDGRGCLKTRKEQGHLQKVKETEMPCNASARQLVPLPVPEGYDSVVPSVTIARRCSGSLCSEKKWCVATNVSTRYVKVVLKSGDAAKCDYVRVEEHRECGCQCIVGKEQCREYETNEEPSTSVTFDSPYDHLM